VTNFLITLITTIIKINHVLMSY